MFFNEEFIARVEENPVVGIVEACGMALEHVEEIGNPQFWTEQEHELLWDTATFIQTIIESNQLNVNTLLPRVTGVTESNCQNLMAYLNGINAEFKEQAVKLKIESFSARYKSSLKNSFAYEFSQGDLERIQVLINELRNSISMEKNLELNHKQRLLKRLESLQSELHKRVSDLDRFWGMVGDAGVVLGKLGADAKPIVDRVREIAEIAWKTQARAEELPSNASNPMLERD